jgi:hypothetical protein
MKVLARLAVLVALGAITASVPKATTWGCPGAIGDSCVNVATCNGDAVRRTGDCKMTCMNQTATEGVYEDAGNCDCGPKRTGGGGSDGGNGGDGGICSVYPEACQY